MRDTAKGVLCGSTPAHAGNTDTEGIHWIRHMVYPRPRGEYLRAMRCALPNSGLPPPTRGIRAPPLRPVG